MDRNSAQTQVKLSFLNMGENSAISGWINLGECFGKTVLCKGTNSTDFCYSRENTYNCSATGTGLTTFLT
jgi:hypothetical protein